MGEHVTVRIPELPAIGAELSLDDRIPVWQSETDSTRQTTLAELRSLMLTGGGGGSYAPVTLGSTILVTIPADLEGLQQYEIPSIAGKDFILRRRGTGALVPGLDYEVLSAGGFKLLREGDTFYEGEVFELELFGLQSGGGTGGVPTATTSSIFTGRVQVASSLTMNATHLNKLMQIRGGSNQVVLTLPKIEDYPENTIICIEATINNAKISRITTQDGQNIYMNNDSFTSLYLHKTEVIWLMIGNDGFYLANDFGERYKSLGTVRWGYRGLMNEYALNGQTLLRAEEPRLWEEVQRMGASLIDDSLWATPFVTFNSKIIPKPYRGCFSRGDGTTTFRLPDMRGMSTRGLLATDPQRFFNNAGGFQEHEVGPHNHEWKFTEMQVTDTFDARDAYIYVYNPTKSNNDKILTSSLEGANFPLKPSAGFETRVDNIGGTFYIKA